DDVCDGIAGTLVVAVARVSLLLLLISIWAWLLVSVGSRLLVSIRIGTLSGRRSANGTEHRACGEIGSEACHEGFPNSHAEIAGEFNSSTNRIPMRCMNARQRCFDVE